MRELSDGRFALTVLNFRPYGEPNSFTFNLKEIAQIVVPEDQYEFLEVMGEEEPTTRLVTEDITVWINVNSCLTWILTPVNAL